MHIILNTYGTRLQKENGIFCVHTPEGKQSIFPDKVKSISISRGAEISSDAALLAIENQVDVIFIDNAGNPAGRIWSSRFGSISTIRRKQIDFAVSPAAVDWIKELIIRKIDNQSALLISLTDISNNNEALINKTIKRLDVYKKKIAEAESELVHDIAPSLRGWEGAASKSYFQTISEILPESVRFETRTQHPAKDIFNMLLNYGYGMLYAKVEGALIKAGIDPYLGIMHRDDYSRPVLAFDVIEIFRVWVDYVVINLAKQEIIDADCYVVTDGNYWLETQGKRILIQSVNDYLEEIVMMNGISRSRAFHIELYSQNLAQIFLNFKDTSKRPKDL